MFYTHIPLRGLVCQRYEKKVYYNEISPLKSVRFEIEKQQIAVRLSAAVPLSASGEGVGAHECRVRLPPGYRNGVRFRLSQRIFLYSSVSAAAAATACAVQLADGVDICPRHVFADEAAGDGGTLPMRLGHETYAGAGDLVGVHLFGRVHAFACGDAGVVEGSQTLHVYRATGVHTCPQHKAEGFEGSFGVGAAHGGDERYLLAKLVHFLDNFL